MKSFLLFITLLLVYLAGSGVIGLLEPNIEYSCNQHFLVGDNITLDCFIGKRHKNLTFRWTLPNPDAIYTNQSTEEPQHFVSFLNVFNVTLNDSGDYKCEVLDKRKTSSSTTTEIKIIEEKDPFINITPLSHIEGEEGEELIWKSTICAYPTDLQITYRNYTGDQINETDRVTITKDLLNGESWLRIRNATVSDFGNYSIEVSSKYETKTKNVTVRIRSKPYVSLNVNLFNIPTIQSIQVSCEVKGYPIPNVKWTFSGNGSCKTQEIRIENESLSIKGITKTVNGTFRPQCTGYLKCIGNNTNGENSSAQLITIDEKNTQEKPDFIGYITLVLAIISVAVLITVIVLCKRRIRKEREFRQSLWKNQLYLFMKGDIGQLNPDCTADEQAELLPYSPEWEVKRDDISLGRQLGAGAFGRVVKAVVTDLCNDEPKTTVAVKMCKNQADQLQVHSLTRELKIMIHIGKHLNIVNLMGANTVNVGKGELWILVEYCRYGNLLTFMHRHRKDFINEIDPMTGNIDPLKNVQGLRFGYQSSTPFTDMDGYLVSTKINLASAPLGRNPSSSPQSPTTVTGFSNRSFKVDGPPHQSVHNPVYRAGLNHLESDCPQGDCNMNRMTNNTSGGSWISEAKNSDQRSTGCNNDSEGINNEYRTTVQSVASSSSPSPHFSFSPTDSSHISDTGIDLNGSPFTFDSGQIPGINAPFTTSDLVCWGWQVAQGMDYLMQRKILHGDLAARNLLLADNNVVKISDFGLSRDMYKKDIYMKKGDDLVPMKWMSIEAIRDRIFSVQSDVWSYGVTLWELFTLGSSPYPGVDVNRDFLTLLENGNRMDRPKYANQKIYNIILDCWRDEPQERPAFRICSERLGLLMSSDVKRQYITMNDPYMVMNEERFRNETDYLNMLSSPDFDNLNQKDYSNLHYSNVPEAVGGNRESSCLKIQSKDLVHYSCSSELEEQSMSPNSHYLPMISTRDSHSPMVSVFSPRPIEDTRFSFSPENEEVITTDFSEIEEEVPSSQTEQAMA